VWPGVVSYVISLQYLFIYIVLLMGLFGLLLNLKYVRNYFNVNTFEELGSLVYTRKPLAWVISLFVISFAGLPPLAGFWSKFFVFYWLAFSNNYGMIVLLLLVSVLSAFYYLRLVRIVFFSRRNFKFFIPLEISSGFLLSLLLFFNIFFGPIVIYFLFSFNIF